MRDVEATENDYEDERICAARWRGPREEIFEAIDVQLEPFGLELVMIYDGRSDYMWRIEKRVA